MLTTIGDPDCHGAIFIYKDDGSIPKALANAISVAMEHRVKLTYSDEERKRIVDIVGYDPTDPSGRFVYIVHASTRAEFLHALTEWHARIGEGQGALMIYAHMGTLGINRISGDKEHRITWSELGDALPNNVASLWLAGCKSHHCLSAWGATAPVTDWLVCTSETKPWAPLIPAFIMEISVDPVYFPEAIARKLDDAFGDDVEYHRRSDNVWIKEQCSEPNTKEGGVAMAPNLDESKIQQT